MMVCYKIVIPIFLDQLPIKKYKLKIWIKIQKLPKMKFYYKLKIE